MATIRTDPMLESSQMLLVGSDMMFFTPCDSKTRNEGQTCEILCTPQDNQSSNEYVELDNDIFEIIPVDPLGEVYKQPQMPFSYALEGRGQDNETLEVLEIFYNHQVDAPEFIDINDLMVPDPRIKEEDEKQDLNGDLADDDVIFVGEYNPQNDVKDDAASTSNEPALRRNPTRKARRNTSDFARDLLYRDYFDDDLSLTREIIKKTARNGAALTAKDYRKWPVSGLHERPEFNAATNKVEKFDYTIREIKNSVSVKRPPSKLTKKSVKKRKYYPRKKPVANDKKVAKEMVPISDLKSITESTLNDLRRFIRNVKLADDIIKNSSFTEEKENVTPTQQANNNDQMANEANNNSCENSNKEDVTEHFSLIKNVQENQKNPNNLNSNSEDRVNLELVIEGSLEKPAEKSFSENNLHKKDENLNETNEFLSENDSKQQDNGSSVENMSIMGKEISLEGNCDLENLSKDGQKDLPIDVIKALEVLKTQVLLFKLVHNLSNEEVKSYFNKLCDE